MFTVFVEAPWHMARKDITLGRKPGYPDNGAPVELLGTGWTPEPGSQGLEKGDGHITVLPRSQPGLASGKWLGSGGTGMFSGGKFVELPYNKENIAAKAGQPVKLNAW